MSRAPIDRYPAVNKRLGRCQLSVSFTEEEATAIERVRIDQGLRSWNEAIRWLVSRAISRERGVAKL